MKSETPQIPFYFLRTSRQKVFAWPPGPKWEGDMPLDLHYTFEKMFKMRNPATGGFPWQWGAPRLFVEFIQRKNKPAKARLRSLR